MVKPAEFDICAVKNMAILFVPEGHDIRQTMDTAYSAGYFCYDSVKNSVSLKS